MDRTSTSHFSAALTKRWFLPMWLISVAEVRLALSGLGLCCGVAFSEVHVACMIPTLGCGASSKLVAASAST